MLKKRIIAVLIVKDGIAVQSIGFRHYLPLGRPEIAVHFLNQWGIDEIILIDISVAKKDNPPNLDLIRSVANSCRVPLAVGGGVSSLDCIHQLMQCGADKVVLNQASLHDPDLIIKAASVFGEQCIIGSIDASLCGHHYKVYDYRTDQTIPKSPQEHARFLQSIGIGEIFLNSVDCDGKKSGFDLQLINLVSESITVPLIVCGGAGQPSHFVDVIRHSTASAIAASNFFHFYEHSVTIVKSLIARDYNIRHETHAQYHDCDLDPLGRLLKKPDHKLDELLYLKIPRDVI
jgi:imidazole glycerol-phosphate synthase subunit HisF